MAKKEEIPLPDSKFTTGNKSKFQIPHIVIGILLGLLGYGYFAITPAPPKICGSPGGPPVTSPRVKLDDGRHLAYRERGVQKEDAKFKIIICHLFGSSKDMHIPLSDEFIKENGVYILSYDRAGYGESDPFPARSVKSEAFDIQDLADKLQLGPKFYVVGVSMGAYAAYSSLKYIPHRLSGVAIVVPLPNYGWKFLPPKLSKEALGTLLVQDQWIFRIAHYTPWLMNWWMTQKWFPTLSMLEGKVEAFSESDLEIIKSLAGAQEDMHLEKVAQQGAHESMHRDLIVGLGTWPDFEPIDIANPFPSNQGSVHIWQGYEDRVIPYTIGRYICERLPWIQYHEVPNGGHLMFSNATVCQNIIEALLHL